MNSETPLQNQKLLHQIASNKNLRKPVIYGICGQKLNDDEKQFFSKNSCIGFILFSRNIKDKTQLKQLTKSLRELMEGEVLILIDQEGGRVSRLQPPHFASYPAGEFFAKLYQQNPNEAKQAIFENFCKIAEELVEVGINVNCAPILDVLTDKTHQIIGDRAYGKNASQVSELGKEVCNGLLSKGVFPVIKHIPGHGRAACDSHLELPIVSESFEELKEQDFAPFIALKNQKFAMTAHVLFRALDCKNCATSSSKIISLIRDLIGFKNILMSDDLSMKALQGSFAEKTTRILAAGCDLILHCNGKMDEMLEINGSLPNLSDSFWENFIN